MNKKAFTLAEVMIVLVVIGVLSAVLIPAARNSMPDKDVVRFKKGYNTLLSAIRELVNSDKYYLDGDLGIKANGESINGGNSSSTDAIYLENRRYLCETFADVVSIKSSNCIDNGLNGWIGLRSNSGNLSVMISANGEKVSPEILATKKKSIDSGCNMSVEYEEVNQIITADNIWFWDAAPISAFGEIHMVNGEIKRLFSSPSQYPANFYDDQGMDIVYKPFCMDIDGVPDNATKNDCINECPFGFGIRADGKILTGARADEWLEKEI